MSTLRVTNIQNAATSSGGISIDTSGHVTVDGIAYPSAGSLSGRNRIINGDFRIWQRGTSFQPDGVIFGADRFASYKAGASAGDYARSTDVPSGEGFTYSGYFNGADIRYPIELPGAGLPGEFVSGSQWTLSFWVKAGGSGTTTTNIGWAPGSTLTSITNWGADQAYNYSTSWQKITSTFTVSGTPAGSDLVALIYFSAVPGLHITGVQLEAGTVATPFERRSYGQELALCQRYYYKMTSTSSFTQFAFCNVQSPTVHKPFFHFPVPLRVPPAAVEYSSLGIITAFGLGVTSLSSLTLDTNINGADSTTLTAVPSTGLGTAEGMTVLLANNTGAAYVAFVAEL